ncbi:hypothetical protein WSM22_32990 [Cytophagales bacterium WSM2-2]|nr:hypothetical protein WSM22_32990 [Cytophagales bacterium WSM2-2]
MKLAQNKKVWTMIELPEQRGTITVADVLRAEPGPARDPAIKEWCSSVWAAYNTWHNVITALVKTELGVR